ncbi:hypothetical protein TWF281_001926 [Arthrobotrys megalospora]
MLSEIQSNPKKRKLPDPSDSSDAPSLTSPTSQQRFQADVAGFVKLQKCGTKEVAQVTKIAENLKQALIGAEGLKFASIQDANAAFRARGVHIPYPECGDDIREVVVSLTPPSRVELGWSLRHGIIRKSEHGVINVDLIVQIPSATFLPKDYLEYLYLRKRILYLSYLVLALKNANPPFDCSYASDFIDGDELRPIVLVDCSHAKCMIRLIPAVSVDLFPIDKLSPTACRADRKTGTPTPMYNSSLIDDAYHLDNLDTLQKYTTLREEFKGALVLGTAWLSCLGFSAHLLDGGFGEREWALLQSHVIETTVNESAVASRYASSSGPFQLFKSVLNLIANTTFPIATDTPTLHRKNTQHNILFKMSRWSFRTLKDHSLAVISFDKLGLSLRAQFQRIFQNQPYTIADLSMSFPVDSMHIIGKLPTAVARRWNIKHLINEYYYDMFAKGLGNRYKTMTFSAPKSSPRELEGILGCETENDGVYNLKLFITLDERNCARILDYGPDVGNTAKTADFRGFWEGKAELRRFKDGRVMETVKWDSASSPTEQILSFLCQKLASPFQTQDPPTFYGCVSDIHSVSPPPLQPAVDLYGAAVSEFKTVADTIRQLKDFPLGFRKISGLSPGLSSTSVDPPFPCSRYLETPLEGELELESSSMWPVDPEQRRRSEFGLLLKLRAELDATGNFIMTHVGIAASLGFDNPGFFLDILTKRQYYFRFRLKNTLEVVPRVIAPALDMRYENPAQILHLQTSVVQKCHQHQYFAPSIRILKKWFRSHHLASFFNEGILELFVAIGFSPYSPFAIPASTYCGFRRIMAYLSHWDWRNMPLEIEVLRYFPDGERTRILREFDAYRSISRNNEACLSVVVAGENGEMAWIRHDVPRLVAIRMTQLARETHTQLTNISTPFSAVFHPDMTFFDFVIVLEQEPSLYEANRKYTNITTRQRKFGSLPLNERFIAELKAQIEEYVLLFPSLDTLIVGGLWKPARELDVLVKQPHQRRPADSRTGNLMYNKTAIFGLIMELGRGLVDGIRVPR